MNEFVQIPVSKEEINRERREEIIQLARDTAELCELSHDINELIGEATPMLLEIEQGTEVALENVCQAKDNVINAQISQSSSNKKKDYYCRFNYYYWNRKWRKFRSYSGNLPCR